MLQRKKRIILFSILLISLSLNISAQKRSTYYPTDTIISFKVGDYWVTPDSSFEFNALVQSSGDTLQIAACSDYIYFPFGKLTNKQSLDSSLLKDFSIIEFKRDTFTILEISPDLLWNESIQLKFGDNNLSLFFDNDPEASMHGYIRGGQIVNDNVVFVNEIKIGMSASEFYKKFFVFFPKELIDKYKVVKIESCVLDVTHIYTFINGCLSSVVFFEE